MDHSDEKKDTQSIADLEVKFQHDETKQDTELLKGIEDEGDCGFFSCRPKFLRYVNTPTGYLYVFGMFMITQGMLVNGYTNVIITTLERRFRLQSFETGLIVVSYDLAYFALCLFVTFYGNRANRPRMLGIGATVFGLGCLVFSIPHFTTLPYKFDGNYSDLCDPTYQASCEPTEDREEDLDAYLYLFIFAMLLQGFGCIPLYTVGFTVLEDSLPRGKSAIYIGIANALTILGPVLGYVVGGYLLTIYVDFDTVDPESVTIDSSDPRWVGAWWVGFLLATGMAWVLVAPPMLAFPKQFPGSAVIRSTRESEVHAHAGEEITEKEEFGKSIKDMPTAMWAMLRNSAFLFTTLGGCSEGFIIAAFTAFLPKFIENQFSLTAGSAAFYAGVVAIPGGVFGMILSAVIIKKLNLKTAGVLKMCIICSATVLVLTPAALMRCPTPVIAGVNIAYSNESLPASETSDSSLIAACNSICNCQEEFFSPVCGVDNITYFSACFAGCDERMPGDDKKYRHCTCIANSQEGLADAADGLCEESCEYLAPFLGVFFVIILINFMTTTPALLVIMRCVPDTQKSFAVGVQWFIVRGLGSIPGPVVFGVIFDATCVLWQESICDQGQGSCWIHDSKEVAVYIMLASLGCKTLSVIFFSTALYVYKPPGKVDDDKITSDDFVFENESMDEKSNDCDFASIASSDCETKITSL